MPREVIQCPSCEKRIAVQKGKRGVISCPGCEQRIRLRSQPESEDYEGASVEDYSDEYEDNSSDEYGEYYDEEESYDEYESRAERRRKQRAAKAKKAKEEERVRAAAKKKQLIAVGVGLGACLLIGVIAIALSGGGDDQNQELVADNGTETSESTQVDTDGLTAESESDSANATATPSNGSSRKPENTEIVASNDREEAPQGRAMLTSKVDRPEPKPKNEVEPVVKQELLKPLKLAQGEEPRSIAQAKAATALIVTDDGTGTGFCIGAGGIFVTNAHVVDAVGVDGELLVVMDSGTPRQKKFTARVIRIDEDVDLAVITVKSKEPLPTLLLGDDSQLVETTEITAFGFPFGNALALEKGGDPSISVNVGHVTSLRKSAANELKLIQIDAQVNPGNSGGPVTNEDREVIGIVASGIQNSGVHFAIPVSALARVLSRPVVVFDAPDAVKPENLDDNRSFVATVSSFLEEEQSYTASLAIKGSKERTIPMELKGDRFEVSTPLELPEKETRVTVEVKFKDGDVSGTTPDREVKVGPSTLKLSQIERITPQSGGNCIVRTHQGKSIIGQVQTNALKRIELKLAGGNTSTVNLLDARTALFPRPQPVASVELELKIKADGKQVASLTRTVVVEGVEPSVAAVSTQEIPGTKVGGGISPDERLAAARTVKLPGNVQGVTTGASGRYLIAKIPEALQIAVIDLGTGKLAKYIPMQSSNALVTAGASHLVVGLPDNNILVSYHLSTFRKALTKQINLKSGMVALSMGNASNGPILIGGRVVDSVGTFS